MRTKKSGIIANKPYIRNIEFLHISDTSTLALAVTPKSQGSKQPQGSETKSFIQGHTMLHYTKNLLLPVECQLSFNKLWNDTQNMTQWDTKGTHVFARKMGCLKECMCIM